MALLAGVVARLGLEPPPPPVPVPARRLGAVPTPAVRLEPLRGPEPEPAAEPAAEPAPAAACEAAASAPEPGPRVDAAVCAMVRDEGSYLVEWIEHHRAAGFGLFVLYDNGSDDDTARRVAEYVRLGVVRLVCWGHRRDEAKQRDAYAHCADTYAGRARWLAFLDADEFAVARAGGGEVASVPAALDRMPADVASVLLSWLLFCNAEGHLERPPGLVTASYAAAEASGFAKQVLRTALLNRTECAFRSKNSIHNCYWRVERPSLPDGPKEQALAHVLTHTERRDNLTARVVDAAGQPAASSIRVRTPRLGPLALFHYRDKSRAECLRKVQRTGGGNRANNRAGWELWARRRYSPEHCDKAPKSRSCNLDVRDLVEAAPGLARRVAAYERAAGLADSPPDA